MTSVATVLADETGKQARGGLRAVASPRARAGGDVARLRIVVRA